MSYKSPIEDLKYNLSMLDYSNTIGSIERFKEYDADTLMSVVGEIGKLNEQEVVETNKIGDREGLKFIPDGAEGPESIRLKYTKNYIKQLETQDMWVQLCQQSLVGEELRLLLQYCLVKLV